MAPNTVFAFFEYPDAELQAFEEATVPKTGRMLDHICFFVESEEELDHWHQRLTGEGIPVYGYSPGRSLFFLDPNNIVFQLSVGSPDGIGFPIHDDPDPAYAPPE